ncbi:MAG: hypothetical protein MR361_04630 [Clostridiales bacterium]|nr:hypothetical protein [Clostridiales bacterium]
MIKMFLIASGIFLVMFFLLVLFSMTKAASEFDCQMEWLNGEIPFREGERFNEEKN